MKQIEACEQLYRRCILRADHNLARKAQELIASHSAAINKLEAGIQRERLYRAG